jgi:hypothetical protein
MSIDLKSAGDTISPVHHQDDLKIGLMTVPTRAPSWCLVRLDKVRDDATVGGLRHAEPAAQVCTSGHSQSPEGAISEQPAAQGGNRYLATATVGS